MARLTVGERQVVLQMLADGLDKEVIAEEAGITSRQVAAVAAHVTMGTYELPSTGPAD